MRSRIAAILGVIVLIGVIAAGIVYFFFWDQAVPIVAMAINYVRYRSAPAGTLVTQIAPSSPEKAAATPAASPATASVTGDWPSYNKTLTSNRFSSLNQINREQCGGLKVLCTYDTGQYTGFNTGLLEVNGALIFTTEYDIFSIDPTIAARTGGRMKTTAGDATGRQPRRRLSGRRAVPRHAGRARAGL